MRPEALGFAKNGYWIEPIVFTQSECDSLLRKLSELRSSKRVGGRRNLMQCSAVQEFANDSRLLDLALSLTGKNMLAYKATLFEKTEQANWLVAFHQDTALPVEQIPTGEGWGSASVKQGLTFAHAPTKVLERILALRIHLDDSTSSNGPLRVIPGSHQMRWLTDVEFQAAQDASEPLECTTPCGGVIAMRPLILHASSKSDTEKSRRVLHIEYAESLELAEGVRLAIA